MKERVKERRNRALGLLVVALSALILAGCATVPGPDPENARSQSIDSEIRLAELRRDIALLSAPPPDRDTQAVLAEGNTQLTERWTQLQEELGRSASPAPRLEPILPEYDPLDDIRVSIEADNEDLRHILRVIAREAGINLLIHPQILERPRRISIAFDNVPVSVVFREVLRLADVHGRIDGNVLRVDPFMSRVYDLDFLETHATAGFSAGGDVLGAGGTGGGGLQGNFRISGQNLGAANPYEQVAAILALLVDGDEDTSGGPGAQDSAERENRTQERPSTSTSSFDRDGGPISGRGPAGSYHLNRVSGTLHLQARPSVVHTFTDLIERYKRISGRQVLVEARILEVRLTDEHRAGVDWQALRERFVLSFGLTQSMDGGVFNSPIGGDVSTAFNLGSVTQGGSNPGLGIGFGSRRSAFLLELIKEYGEVRVLSNPTIRAKHSQPALISVGQSQTFVSETEITRSGDPVVVSADVTTDTVFDGLMVGLVPFIAEDGRITLNVHPIQSSVVPGSLELRAVGGDSQVSLPRVDLKQISTTLDLRSGDTIVLGGLIDTRSSSNRRGVPVLADVPLFGRAFSSNRAREETREFVLLLEVTIL